MKFKVKALISFNDLEEKKHRNIGDEFECSKQRCDYLLEHKAIEIIKEAKIEEIASKEEENSIDESNNKEKPKKKKCSKK